VTWDTDAGTLMYLTGWREFKSDFVQDGDFTPFLIFENHNRQFDNEQFSHELQYTGSFIDEKLDITAGLYTFQEEGREIVRIKGDPRTQAFIAMGMGGLISDPPIFFDNIRDIDNESSAIYLQAVYHATDRLHLTGGIRTTEDTKKYGLHLDFLGRPDAADAMGAGSETYDETTPMVSIGYDFADNVFGYLTWSEGFRDGGFAARFPGGALPNPLPGFQAEFVTSYEVGIKSELFDRRLRANVALFTTDYEDFQTSAAPVGVAPGTVAGTIINIGDVEMFGFETELMAQLGENFTWTWNIGYIDTDLVCINTFDANGIPTDCSPTNTASTGGFIIGVDHELPRQPEWNWNMGFVYNQRIDGMMQGAELSWRANWTYTDEMETALTNIALTRNPDWSRVDASVTLHPSNEQWSLQLGARNLFDENYELQRATQSNTVFAVKARPRQLYATYRYNFGGR
jgi:iron complex outermembrane receptor protein